MHHLVVEASNRFRNRTTGAGSAVPVPIECACNGTGRRRRRREWGMLVVACKQTDRAADSPPPTPPSTSGWTYMPAEPAGRTVAGELYLLRNDGGTAQGRSCLVNYSETSYGRLAGLFTSN